MGPTADAAHASHLEVGANAGPPAVHAAVGVRAVMAYARHDLAILAARSAAVAALTMNALVVDAFGTTALRARNRRRPSSFFSRSF